MMNHSETQTLESDFDVISRAIMQFSLFHIYLICVAFRIQSASKVTPLGVPGTRKLVKERLGGIAHCENSSCLSKILFKPVYY